jgi:ABC-type transporter Mla MlaB component
MTLRIEQFSDRGHTTIRLIGRMQAEHLPEVQKQIAACGPKVALDLEEVALVDVQGVRFLATCEAKGVDVLNCSANNIDWIARERA